MFLENISPRDWQGGDSVSAPGDQCSVTRDHVSPGSGDKTQETK